jgi:hypothetical protein
VAPPPATPCLQPDQPGSAFDKEHAMYDVKNLTRLKKLDANAPDVMKQF